MPNGLRCHDTRNKIQKNCQTKREEKWDRAKLNTDVNRGAFQGEIEEELKGKMGSIVNVEDRWQVVKEVI